MRFLIEENDDDKQAENPSQRINKVEVSKKHIQEDDNATKFKPVEVKSNVFTANDLRVSS